MHCSIASEEGCPLSHWSCDSWTAVTARDATSLIFTALSLPVKWRRSCQYWHERPRRTVYASFAAPRICSKAAFRRSATSGQRCLRYSDSYALRRRSDIPHKTANDMMQLPGPVDRLDTATLERLEADRSLADEDYREVVIELARRLAQAPIESPTDVRRGARASHCVTRAAATATESSP